MREPPEDGRANAALCALIAEALDVPTSRARLVAGAKSRIKQIAVAGDPAALIDKLRALWAEAAPPNPLAVSKRIEAPPAC